MDEKNMNLPMASVGGKEKGYLFEFFPMGVFFTVYPYSDTQILFELTDIQKLLKAYGVKAYEIELLTKTIREALSLPVKIADHFDEQMLIKMIRETTGQEVNLPEAIVAAEKENFAESQVKLDISKTKMEASMRIEMKENSKKPDKNMLLELIQKAGIVFGIKMEALNQLVQGTLTDAIVAVGNPPVNGTDAVIKKKNNMADRGRPSDLEYSRVDYKNLNWFIVVKKGDVLAERIPHTHGVPGMDILGGVVPAKSGKPKPLPNGKNTKVVDENIIVADLDGQLVENGNKIMVDPTIEIKGDVDLSTGNIDFNGSVLIKGSVQAGFAVRADGDVEIRGTISGGNVEAKNITVFGGVQGMNRGVITAQEDIRATFAENAKMIAGRDIHIGDVILHSNLSAGGKVFVEEHRGLINGGSIAAGEEIRAKCVGNTMNTATKLEVGVNPMLREKYQKIKVDISNTKKQLDKVQKALAVMQQVDKSKLSQDKKEKLAQLIQSQFPLAGKLHRYEDELVTMQNAFEVMKSGKIRVLDKIYPGAKLVMGSLVKNIQNEAQHCVFYVDEEDATIKTGAY